MLVAVILMDMGAASVSLFRCAVKAIGHIISNVPEKNNRGIIQARLPLSQAA